MARIAAMVVDIENCFAHPEGGLYVRNSFDVVQPANSIIYYTVSRGGIVLASFDWHHPQSRHFCTNGGKWPIHGVMGTWDALPACGLNLPPNTFIIYKGMQQDEQGYDLWEGRTLADNVKALEIMRQNEITDNLVCGIATEYCVKAAVLSSLKNQYRTYLVRDACCAVNEFADDEERAIEEMKDAGAVITTVEEVVNGKL